MVRLADRRLAVTYGYRSLPLGIRAKISLDNGRTWNREILLRVDARAFDFGYTRMVRRSDGKLVTVYCFTIEQDPEQHITETIWDPDTVECH